MEDSLESPLFEKAENLAEQSLQRIVDVVDYAEDTYEYLQHIEVRFLTNFEMYLKASVLWIVFQPKYQPRKDYMKRQPDITYPMRRILVDWLVEVAEEHKLERETLFLAVNCIDRFLCRMSVVRGRLQLVGAASMFMAAWDIKFIFI